MVPPPWEALWLEGSPGLCGHRIMDRLGCALGLYTGASCDENLPPPIGISHPLTFHLTSSLLSAQSQLSSLRPPLVTVVMMCSRSLPFLPGGDPEDQTVRALLTFLPVPSLDELGAERCIGKYFLGCL